MNITPLLELSLKEKIISNLEYSGFEKNLLEGVHKLLTVHIRNYFLTRIILRFGGNINDNMAPKAENDPSGKEFESAPLAICEHPLKIFN